MPSLCQACACPIRLTCAVTRREALFHERVAPDEVAAVFIEPILGEGGYVVPPKSSCSTGGCSATSMAQCSSSMKCNPVIGRTGRMFASELFDVFPDVTLLAKGLASGMPLGAIVAKRIRHDLGSRHAREHVRRQSGMLCRRARNA